MNTLKNKTNDRFETLLLNKNGVSVYSNPYNAEQEVITDFWVAYCEGNKDKVFEINPHTPKSVYLI